MKLGQWRLKTVIIQIQQPHILPVKLFLDATIACSEVNLPSEWLNVPLRPSLGKLILNNCVIVDHPMTCFSTRIVSNPRSNKRWWIVQMMEKVQRKWWMLMYMKGKKVKIIENSVFYFILMIWPCDVIIW